MLGDAQPAKPAESAPPAVCRCPCSEKMDNEAFDANGEMPHRTASTTVELGELASAGRPAGAPLCKPDLCRAMAMPQGVPQGVIKPPAMRPNPWHRYKTIFLVGTVVGLVVWAVAYFFLDSNKMI